jgi:hypothetical protein
MTSEVGTVIATRAPAPVMGLTKRQSEALAFIRDALSLGSKSGVHRIVHGLRKRGAIDFLDSQQRSICIVQPERV